MAREVWRNLNTTPSPCQPIGTVGMLDSAMIHWRTSGGDLSRAMDTMSSGENILETIFSFQPEQVEVFVNTEGARAEDVSLRMCPEDGGFELSVAHREEGTTASARREVRRLYNFQRPLYWNRAVANVTPEGVLHLVVPGPVLQSQPQPFPIDPCF
ncbi:unnamed protein product [Nezara viridula]|uniref:Uncharacterized protein n=1 Tax=Nezara viridula TaxID=85310 RepID=A0A9P0HLU2_NEZVI|nr:unnamed protein product [Nezara viridula]